MKDEQRKSEEKSWCKNLDLKSAALEGKKTQGGWQQATEIAQKPCSDGFSFVRTLIQTEL